MAAGRRVGLAVPVLASIYKGLNKISGSPRLIRMPSPFPFHFVYSWIAHYFKTHYQVLQGVRGPKMTLFSGEGGAKYYDPQEARKRIHKGVVSFNAPNAKKFSSEVYKGWWIETHSSFLEENAARLLSPTPIKALPKDKERGKRVVQDVPRECAASVPPKCNSQVVEVIGTSKKKSVSRPLEENESSNLDRHWKRPKRDSNISKPMNVDGDSSSHAPSMLNFAKELEDEVLDIEDDEASEDSQESILGSNLLVNTFPIGMGPKAKLPCHASVPVFEGERFVLNHQKEFLQKMWSDLLVKISKTPVDFISSIQGDLKEASTRLQDAQDKESEEVSKIESIIDELERIEKKLVDLKEQRTQLCAALKGKNNFSILLKLKFMRLRRKLQHLRTPHHLMMNEDLESSRVSLEVLKEELENLSPFT
ncbi:UNVERIFIED_CONTAM: hypothetical protein Sradi_5281100 [Sesamum radiatum]|uniref:Aminotransferase-like plant mobile domain-containing protein n=1 Tax=Sesamum radiatum TaxID=300843 RepID=A0AAW2LPW7_SESRA